MGELSLGQLPLGGLTLGRAHPGLPTAVWLAWRGLVGDVPSLSELILRGELIWVSSLMLFLMVRGLLVAYLDS